MRTLLVVALSSALVGGVAGAGVALAVTSGSAKRPAKHAALGPSDASAAPSDATLEERLANVEQAVRVLERRRATLAALGAASDAGAAPASRPGSMPEAPSELVDDPVFEAAVRDVIERAEADRDTERELRRDDRRKQAAARWVDDMAPRLGLSEPQKAKLLEIAQQFMGDLGRLWEGDGGAPAPREQRRTEVQKLRDQAEQKLRGVLDPNQARTYDALPEDDKFGPPRRRGASGPDLGRDPTR